MSMPAYGGRDQAPPEKEEKETKWTRVQAIVGIFSLVVAFLSFVVAGGALYMTKAVADKQSATAKKAVDIQKDMQRLTQEGNRLDVKRDERAGAHLTLHVTEAQVVDPIFKRPVFQTVGENGIQTLDARTLMSGDFSIYGTVSNLGESANADIDYFGLGTDAANYVKASRTTMYCKKQDSDPWGKCVPLKPGDQETFAFIATLDNVRSIDPEWRTRGTEVCVRASSSDSQVVNCENFPNLVLPSLNPTELLLPSPNPTEQVSN